MKRLKTVLCAVLVAVLGLICLTACGKTGTYKFSYMKMTQGATSIEIRAGESYMGLILSEEAFVMELREDGTASMSMDMFGETSPRKERGRKMPKTRAKSTSPSTERR